MEKVSKTLMWLSKSKPYQTIKVKKKDVTSVITAEPSLTSLFYVVWKPLGHLAETDSFSLRMFRNNKISNSISEVLFNLIQATKRAKWDCAGGCVNR